jgi:hypothetical protein
MRMPYFSEGVRVAIDDMQNMGMTVIPKRASPRA